MSLAAHEDVGTAFHHIAVASAVAVLVSLAVGGAVVDLHRGTAFDRFPGVRTAAPGMDSRVVNAERRLAVYLDVLRTGGGWANAIVRAIHAAMGVLGNARTVTKSGLRGHLQES